jgi:hypothetical protein
MPEYQIPALAAGGRADDLVTIVSCATVSEANRVVKTLKRAGIVARIADALGVALSGMADLQNSFPHIRIQIAREDYLAARALLNSIHRAPTS